MASEGRSRGASTYGGQRERVRGQSRKLLYSIPMALCEEIASAATAELADGRASRTEARGISYMSFFSYRHALRRRPISRPTWHTAAARRLRLRTLGRTCSDAAPVYLPRHSQQERVATAAAPPKCARHLRSAAARRAGSASAALQGFSAQSSTCAAAARVSSKKSPLVSALRCVSEGSGASQAIVSRISGHHAAPVLCEVGLQSAVGARVSEVKADSDAARVGQALPVSARMQQQPREQAAQIQQLGDALHRLQRIRKGGRLLGRPLLHGDQQALGQCVLLHFGPCTIRSNAELYALDPSLRNDPSWTWE